MPYVENVFLRLLVCDVLSVIKLFAGFTKTPEI